jgi:hypothetical protein
MKELIAVACGWCAGAVSALVFGLSWLTPLLAIAVTMAMYSGLKLLR